MNKTVAHLAVAGVLALNTVSAIASDRCTGDWVKYQTAPSERYSDHGNGTITDLDTNLMWMECAAGKTGSDCTTDVTYTGGSLDAETGLRLLNWNDALNYAAVVNSEYTADATVNPGGYNNWRLPNLKELESLVERCRRNPSINQVIFPNTPKGSGTGGIYWSSTPAFQPEGAGKVKDVPFHAWTVDFVNGNDWRKHKSNNTYPIRLVRDVN